MQKIWVDEEWMRNGQQTHTGCRDRPTTAQLRTKHFFIEKHLHHTLDRITNVRELKIL